jgi:flagellar hook-length control protein FliK
MNTVPHHATQARGPAAQAGAASAAATAARAAGASEAAPADAFAELLQALSGDLAGAEPPVAGEGVPVPGEGDAAPGAQASAVAPAVDLTQALPVPAEPRGWQAVLMTLPLAGGSRPEAGAASSQGMAGEASAAAGIGGPRTAAKARCGADGVAPAAADGAAAMRPAAPATLQVTAQADATSGAAASTARTEAASPSATAVLAPHPAWMPAAASLAAPDAGAAVPVHQAAIPSHPLDRAFGGDVAAEVQLMAEGGLQHAELRLNPVELGPVRIELTVNAGAADISFAAAHATTREGLSQALPALREMLASQGLQLGHAGVGAGTGGQGGHADPSAWRGPERSDRSGSSRGATEAAPIAQGTAAVQRGRGLLDLYA